ncbi:transposase [Streptomyces vinaceus]|uniref:transposase n=1 Tax=Streptomyces vinaceus TaxID=1960 RepID=UPI0038256C6F
MPKKIDPALRSQAVRLVSQHRSEYSTERAVHVQVAESLGVSRESVRRWVAQHKIGTGVAASVTSDEREGLKRLRAETKRLREVNEVLKSATISFARELDSETVDRRLRRPDECRRSCRRVDPRHPEHRRTEDRGTNRTAWCAQAVGVDPRPEP